MALTEIAATAAAAVGAAEKVINIVGDAIELADRSCVIDIVNMTADTLEFTGSSHESGGFGQGPPPRIAPFDSAVMSSRSTAFAQGAVGTMRFAGRDVTLDVDFGNPFVGSNHIDGRVSGPRAGEFEVHSNAGGGNTRARFTCVITHPIQDNWRFCGKCHGMFFNGPD